MNQIDTIIFDLGSVLIDWNPMPLYIRAFNGDEKKAQWFLENVCTYSWNLALDGGKDWHEAISEKIIEFPEYESYIRLYYDEWDSMVRGEITGTVEILQKLKDLKKYRLYSITNWGEETFKRTYPKFDFLKWFEGISVSGVLKMVKPNKEIFIYTLERYNLKAQKSLFIDDNHANIATANSLGFNTILFTNPQNLEESLKAYNIKL